MTVENGTRPRRTSRARRNSVVQRIAVNIPQLAINDLLPHHVSRQTLRRTHSSGDIKTVSDKSLNYPQALQFPYSDAEKDAMITRYIDSFDYNVLPSAEELKLMDDQQNSKYTRFLESCQFREHNYTELAGHATAIIDELTDLTVKYNAVTTETFEFQSQSDALMEQYNSYISLNEDLKSNLHYYELLTTITRKLNNPSPNIVRRESFRRLLEQLDECIQFCDDHKDHKDHDTFMRRFKQCLTRALTLVRNYVMNHLKTIRDEISAKTANTKPNSVTEDALIYTRFASDGDFLLDVSAELCKRAPDSEEYSGLLNDCYNFYFGIRQRLLQPKITEHINTSTSEKKSLVTFSQSNISFFTKIYKDEHELFFKFFKTDHEQALSTWFQQLSEPLYDTLRNSILREQSLNSLCELATLLDKYYEYDEENAFEHDAILNTASTSTPHPDFTQIDLGTVFEPILQDVQSRLVFRAQAYAQEKIVKYVPTPRDFQISHRRSITRNASVASTASDSPSTPLDDDTSLIMESSAAATAKSEGWYPPLSKGVALLSKIYQLVSSGVFDDLAHNIVHDCIISLREAYRVAKTTTGNIDADLFLLKNLLMLRNQVQNFDIEYVSSETFLDFSGVGDIISKIRNGDSVLNDDGILGLVKESVPKVVKNMIDARMELQTELRNVVHSFTEDVVKQIVEPLQKSTVETADSDTQQLQQNIEEALPRVKNQAQMFINDPQVVNALIDGIQELVIQSYEKYYDETGHKVTKSVNVVEVDTMIAFIGEIVGKMYEPVEDDRQKSPVEKMAELSLESSPVKPE
ncbi:CYFA0S01e14576g1_1 [Cyberlindnera fabianii]|uniref:Conserved oligomeric Golgi complex subunit 3 n=1 Tax=Cyberlindnera fabianii TaxID=36022 RepID=A0A061ASF7_CYBFA|nr:CYFA0S01e14576g1_1 [Cyberlindnera fabianii]